MSGASRSFRAALVQMCSGTDVGANIETASALVRQAAGDGAHYVQTPEVTTLIEAGGRAQLEKSEPDNLDNTAVRAFASLADELGIWLHVGSMAVRTDGEKLANRAFLFSPEGEIAARYDKIHMFDVDVDGDNRFSESRRYAAGSQAVVAPLPWCNLGITICYDMRFPYLYRDLAHAGAEVIAVPSAFTVPTGKAHWHTLLRARAIETECFVLAAAQAGEHESGRKSYGHSIIISPWGEVLAEADGLEIGVISANIELSAVAEARKRVPSLQHDRRYEMLAPQSESAKLR